MAAKRAAAEKVEVRTPNVPGHTGRVDKSKYEAMKKLVLELVPKKAPGITQDELFAKLDTRAPRKTFPKFTYMWWSTTVRLDLESRGLLERDGGKPLRWRRVK